MATGIVSLACNGAGMPPLAHALFWLNVLIYPVLWGLLVTRCVRHTDRVHADFLDHSRAPGFFATVAGTCILGNQCVLLYGAAGVGLVLWVAGLVLWVGLTYTILPA